MKKHLFTIRWEREGTRAYPTFEFYRAFDWPDKIIANEAIPAAARVTGLQPKDIVDKVVKQLPQECTDIINMMPGLYLRARYSPETQGPYMIDDPRNELTEEMILSFVEHSEDRLKEFRV